MTQPEIEPQSLRPLANTPPLSQWASLEEQLWYYLTHSWEQIKRSCLSQGYLSESERYSATVD